MGNAPVSLASLVGSQQMDQGIWCQFKSTDFHVKITFYGKAQMTEMVERTKVVSFDTRTLQEKEEMDKAKFRREYARTVIRDWKGLTPEVLRQLIVIDPSVQLPADFELPCTDENKEVLIAQSVEFDQWLQRSCSSVELFNRQKSEAEEKN